MLVVPLVTTLTNGWAVANLLITLVAFAAVKVGLLAGAFVSPDHASFHYLVEATNGAGWLAGLGDLLSVLVMLNALIFVFNMLPLPPLDGASAIGEILPERAAPGPTLRGQDAGAPSTKQELNGAAPAGDVRSRTSTLAQPCVSSPAASGVNQATRTALSRPDSA